MNKPLLIVLTLVFGIIGMAPVQQGLSQNDHPVINEIMSSNISGIPDEYEVDTQNCPVPDCDWWYDRMGDSVYDGNYPDWIEIFNPGTPTITLSGYGLSDDPSHPYKWRFPNVNLKAGEYLIVFASGKNKWDEYVHTNFKIARCGEIIVLTNASGHTIDAVKTGEIPVDFSLGRYPNAEDNWALFSEPTPGISNSTPPFPGFSDTVSPSHVGGFYSSSISLALSANSPGTVIYYTLNGDDPNVHSTRYENPISIRKTTVVKAQGYKNGQIVSRRITHTYFIDEDFNMPAISLATPSENLWDPDLGIYVPGNNADENNRVANYWQDWERPVHIEFFEPDGTPGFSIDAGLRIFGWATRQNAQKSVAIMMRDRYGYPEINYPVFPDLPFTQFKSLVLRAGGSDWAKAFFRDPFCIRLIRNLNQDYQAFRPAIVFMNGEYWGIQNIREKLNEDYLATHHDINKEEVDIISRYWRRSYPVVIEGDVVAYMEMENFIHNHDISQSGNYAVVKNYIDIDNLIDYSVSQIYFANYDWPGNNNKTWRSRAPGSKWRWLMFDLDYTFDSHGPNNATHNTLVHATTEFGSSWPNPAFTTMILRKLLENTEFRNKFVNRMADFMNTIFTPKTMLEQLDAMQDLYSDELPEHIDRWRAEGGISSMTAWENNLQTIRTFIRERPGYVRQHVRNYFGLTGWSEIKLAISPQHAGRIKINSIVVDDLPWEGIYFHGIPVKISVLPAPGYRFVDWQGVPASDQYSSQITLNLTKGMSLTANFMTDNKARNAVVINEINYNSGKHFNPDDWIEIHSTYTIPLDVSGWMFQDREVSHAFIIPEETSIESNGYLVLCRDTVLFKSVFPNVKNYVGNLNFGLDNDGELLRLYDSYGTITDSLTYDDQAPWPLEPDGLGASLALADPGADNSLAENWQTSVGHGTPGQRNKTLVGVMETHKTETLPQLKLEAGFPNPSNASVVIRYSLPQKCCTRISFYNLLGQRISSLIDEEKEPGKHQLILDTSELASGIYIVRLDAGMRRLTSKITVIK